MAARASSSLLRWLSKTKTGGSAVVRRWMSSTNTLPGHIIRPLPSTLKSPSLMLGGGGDLDHQTRYNFFNFRENQVVSVPKDGGELGADADPMYVGSSHGWLAWINLQSCDLFLSNPFSGRHVRLPSIFPLLGTERSKVKYPYYLSRWVVTKVILSSPSPYEEDSIAMMIYGRSRSLAFCRRLAPPIG